MHLLIVAFFIVLMTIMFSLFIFLFLLMVEIMVCFIYTKLKKRMLGNLSQPVSTDVINKSYKQHIKSYIQRLALGNYLYFNKQVGKIPSQHIRKIIYRFAFGVNLDKKVVIYGGVEMREPYKLSIGVGTVIGNDAILDARNGIQIGKSVNLSTGVWLWTEQHDYQSQTFALDNKKKGIVIGDRAWLGPRVIVLPDVVIGEGAVVAAGAVVTGDLEPYSLYGGIPAKKIKDRNHVTYDFMGDYLPFI